MSILISEVHSLEQALELIDQGDPRIISRIPREVLFQHAAMTRGGVFDFCGTASLDNQWRAFEALMSPESRQRGTDAIAWYHEARNNGSAPDDLADPDWFLGAIMEENIAAVDASLALQPIMLAEADGVLIEDVRAAGRELRPRPGIVELMALMQHKIIISFGIEQMIRAWQIRHNLQCPIAAIRLSEDGKGQVHGFNMNLILPMTKALSAARWRELTGIFPERVMSIGDTIFDTDMMHPDGFNVLIVPPGEADRKVAAFRKGQLQHMWEKLTMVLYADSLVPLAMLIKRAQE